jgi:hypothetical protein
MIIDILTSTQSMTDGLPVFTWKYKQTAVINWSPIGWNAKIQMGVLAGGETYPADSRAWMIYETDIIPGNRLSYNSGATYYDVVSVFSYEDHKEAELRQVVSG